MLLKSLTFDENEAPENVTVTMTVAEASALVRLTGKRSRAMGEEDGILYEHTTSVYDCLASMFNSFYDDGVDDYLRGIGVR